MSYWLCARPRGVFFFFKKKACPESSIWSIDVGECGQEGERWKGGKMKGGRKRETRREGLFFGFSASVIKLSHVRDRWSWCLVCVYMCMQALASAGWCDPPKCAHTHKHTHKHTHYWALPLILPPAGRLRAATRLLPSAVSQPRGSDSSSAVR